MSLNSRLAAIKAATPTKPEAKKTFVDGTTFVAFEVSHHDAKGTTLDVEPGRGWVSPKDNVVLTQAATKGLYVLASKTQALVSVGAPVESLGHLLDRPFVVKATPAVMEYVADHAFIGGKSKVAYHKAVAEASKTVRPQYKKALAEARTRFDAI
ncbi:MAG: hypothetical protein FIB06_04560 [Betaproteobacteria bacterium]|nr:hypothetical protein [Betaproteobacteria bacterium]